MQSLLFVWGRFIQAFWPLVLVSSMIVFLGLCVPLKNASIEMDIVKLWVESGGRLSRELSYLDEAKHKNDLRLVATKKLTELRVDINAKTNWTAVTASIDVDEAGGQLGGGLSGGFTLFIQTAKRDGQSIMTQEDLLEHARILTDISNLKVNGSLPL